ncbi:hypothetical protein ACEPAH_3865 [Sanghuangporus vaninii]
MNLSSFLFILFFIGMTRAGQERLRAPRLGAQELLHHVSRDATETNHALFIDMPVDHFGNSTATFKNRYWINSTYYEPGGPVFIFDSGEQNAEPLLPYYLQEYHGLSATMRLAKRYRGLAILWEHRFYGASLPFPVNINTTADQWKFLTTEQALEDVVFFANSFPTMSDDSTRPAIHPSVTPWIWLGGSYPGVRGTFMRIRNPEVIFATWASSAPVHAQVDMASYYKAAERSLTRNCSADWVAVTKYVDSVLNGTDGTRRTDIKFDLEFARLSGTGGDTTLASNLTREEASRLTNVQAAGILMNPLSFYQYYGFNASLLPFCNLLETQNFTEDPVETGIAAAHGVQAAFKAFTVAIAELDYDSIPRSPDDPVTDMSWMWQYCSEYGFYQRGDPNNPFSIETEFRSLELFQEQCNSAFPEGLPASPAVDHINKYGSWDMTPSNVLFTNGEFDPWRTMGLASIEPNAPQRQPTLSIPKCDAAPEFPSFFGITYTNMVHVTDMRVLLEQDANHTDFRTIGFYSPVSPEPFYAGLGLFQLALDEWLPCFQSQTNGSVTVRSK